MSPDFSSEDRIGEHPVAMCEIDVGARRVRLCSVARLEERVDRTALLRGDAEPPYWAYLWAGATILARYLGRWVDVRGKDVLEIGCGLALPGLTAAAMGAATTTLVDVEPAALAFAAASAAANRVDCRTLAADFTRLDERRQFDLVLAAEVAYERSRYVELAAVFRRHLRPGGVALLADGHRTDTRGLYAALAALELDTLAVDVRVMEEGRPIPVRVTVIREPTARVRPRDTPPRLL